MPQHYVVLDNRIDLTRGQKVGCDWLPAHRTLVCVELERFLLLEMGREVTPASPSATPATSGTR